MVGQLIASDRATTGSLATKVGNAMIANDPTTAACRGAGSCARCDASLRACGTDYVDIYYLHRDDPGDAARGDASRAIGDLIRAGKIRYFGRIELPRLAHRRDRARLRAARRAAAGRAASRTTTC